MKRLVLTVCFVFCVLPSFSQDSRDKIIQALEENRYRAAAGHCPYETVDYKETPAPKGYEVVYLSHYGRHGSRYQGSREPFEKVLPLLDSLASMQLLTPIGDTLRNELHLMYEAHDKKEGLLTQKGIHEQSELAKRLCGRFSKLFHQNNSSQVSATSTPVFRCLQSMSSFMAEVKGASPKLDIAFNLGLADHHHYLAPRVDAEDKAFIRSCYEPVQDSLLVVSKAVSSVAQRVFTDVERVRSVNKGRTFNRFVYEIFEAAQGAGCLDVAVDPLRFYTPEELYDFLEVRNLYFCANYGPLAPTREMRGRMTAPLLRGIIQEADAALAGNGRCADFRFGHDSGLGPLLVLMGIEGFDKGIDPRYSLTQWPAWKYVPMCSNMQIVFYRNRKGEVLVKFLKNEKESVIPALESVDGVYYKWTDVRRYLLARTADPIPEYYVEYLNAKSQEIIELKKEEADGFFFWTDSHYPENGGNAVTVINYLQDKVGVCFVFNGGDIAKNADNLKSGLNCNMPAFAMASSHNLFFPIRGNHDYTSSTSRNALAPESMDDKQVCEYLSSFRSASAVMNNDEPYSNYYYVDSPKGQVRYIVLDTTDSIEDSRVVYGMSGSQLEWVFGKAMKSLPDGWSVAFLSHVPLSPEHTINESINKAATLVSETAASQDVLFCLSGHRHSDMETGIGSVFQVLTESDCLKDTGRTRTPYSLETERKIPGTINEQTIDYVSISKDHKVITMKRIGHGYDRVFNVSPIIVKANSTVQLQSSYNGSVTWFAYDADGTKVGKYGSDGYRDLHTKHKYVEISDSGLVRGLTAGTSSIAVATYEDGTKEYYMIKTIN